MVGRKEIATPRVKEWIISKSESIHSCMVDIGNVGVLYIKGYTIMEIIYMMIVRGSRKGKIATSSILQINPAIDPSTHTNAKVPAPGAAHLVPAPSIKGAANPIVEFKHSKRKGSTVVGRGVSGIESLLLRAAVLLYPLRVKTMLDAR